jgi:DNA topoisomerase-3
VNEEMVSDHPAIIPQINDDIEAKYDGLNERQKNIFDEVVFRFLSVFYGDYVYESIKLITSIDEYQFISNIVKVIDQGWKCIYDHDLEEKIDSALNVGKIVEQEKAAVVDKKTTPPKHFTEDTLLELMDNPRRLIEVSHLKQALQGRGIGTEATRSSLIEALINKGYVERKQNYLISTELGREIISYVDIDILKRIDLTADIEANLERINKGEISKEEFMKEAVKFIVSGIKHIKNKKPIEKKAKILKSLGTCLKCKKGKIVKNKAGYGCTELKNGCDFFVAQVIEGTYIDERQVKKLLNEGRTDMMSFKNGKYRSRIIYNSLKNKTEFRSK